MDSEIYRYKAFVSYRHVDRDRIWARWLIDSLETYRAPRALIRTGVAQRIGTLFRDDDEIPASADLSDEIEEALRASEYLIVVCSPETPKSLWVRREIELFQAMGREDRILALLVDGEPEEAFPPELRRVRRERTGPDGKSEEYWEESEPIAANVRPGRTKERHQAARAPAHRRRPPALSLRRPRPARPRTPVAPPPGAD